jgi:predicted DNA-binding transcriptional regulator AlpA
LLAATFKTINVALAIDSRSARLSAQQPHRRLQAAGRISGWLTVTTIKTTKTKKPAAQVEPANKAAALKAAADKKKAQSPWLRDLARQLPPLSDESLPSAAERMRAAHQSQGPPRLLDKAQVCVIANASYPTVWAWMRAGTFPRSRAVGGRSMWLSSEVDAWLAALPVRPLKGDAGALSQSAEGT